MVSIVCGANMNSYVILQSVLNSVNNVKQFYAFWRKRCILRFLPCPTSITEFNYRANNTEEAQVFVA